MTRPNVVFRVGFACTSNIPGEKGQIGPQGIKGDTGSMGPVGRAGPSAAITAGGVAIPTTFLDLTDTPPAYPAPAVDDEHWKSLIKVKHRADGLEFTDQIKAGTF